MKRHAIVRALGAAAVIALLGAAAIFGPDLYGYYRLEQALSRQFEAAQADAGPWPQYAQSCYGCHGPHGRAANAQYPALAGLPAPYIESQLRAFADGARRSPYMGPVARNLSEVQVKTLADYYARQTPQRNEKPPSGAALDAEGRAAVQDRACAACHGEGLKGKSPAPRLAGQGETYLAQQLVAFKNGQRLDPTGAMNGVATNLSDHDIGAIARHLAGISP